MHYSSHLNAPNRLSFIDEKNIFFSSCKIVLRYCSISEILSLVFYAFQTLRFLPSDSEILESRDSPIIKFPRVLRILGECQGYRSLTGARVIHIIIFRVITINLRFEFRRSSLFAHFLD